MSMLIRAHGTKQYVCIVRSLFLANSFMTPFFFEMMMVYTKWDKGLKYQILFESLTSAHALVTWKSQAKYSGFKRKWCNYIMFNRWEDAPIIIVGIKDFPHPNDK